MEQSWWDTHGGTVIVNGHSEIDSGTVIVEQ